MDQLRLDLHRPARTATSRRLSLWLAAVLAASLQGCAKKAAPAPSADNGLENLPAMPAAKRAPRAAEAKENVDQNVGVVDPFMTQQLRIFVRESGRMPENFADFANARMDSVPRAPAGMKWVIDRAALEVKLARK